MSCAGKRKARAEANQSDSTRRADSPAAAEVGRRPQAPCAGGSRGSRASRRPTQPVGPRGWAHRPCTSPGPSTASSEWCGPVTRQAESYGCNPSLGCRGGGTVAGAGRATVAEWRGPDTEPRLPRPERPFAVTAHCSPTENSPPTARPLSHARPGAGAGRWSPTVRLAGGPRRRLPAPQLASSPQSGKLPILS